MSELTSLPRRAWTINEFCQRYGWNRSYYYRMKKRGMAPPSSKLFGKVMIFDDDLIQWELLIKGGSLGFTGGV